MRIGLRRKRLFTHEEEPVAQAFHFSQSSAGRERALALIEKNVGPIYEAAVCTPDLIRRATTVEARLVAAGG